MEPTPPKIHSAKKLRLPGLIHKYGLNGGDLIYALLGPQEIRKSHERWLAGISLERGLLWERTDLPAHPRELRIARNGHAYISLTDTILEVSPTGETERVIDVAVAPHQLIGSFVLLEDGFLISIQGKREPDAAVIKTDRAGQVIWSTQIPAEAIAYHGVVTMALENNWEARPSSAWMPRTWKSMYSNEILVCGRSALVSFEDMPSSGIGMSYHLNLETGTINWTTDPAPYQSICYAGDGGFLIGYQGYGAFETKWYAADGTVIGQWSSSGELVIGADGRRFVVEMDNSSQKLHCTELLPDNHIERGPRIPGYYIVSPAIDADGRIVFFRNNRLFIIDPDRTVSTLKLNKSKDLKLHIGNMAERILLRDGLIILGLADTLQLLESNLGPLAASPWPCKYGNLARNPVIPA